MGLQTSEASAKAGPGVLLADEPGNHSAKALRLQILTGRGVSPNMALLLAPIVWGGLSND